MIEKPLNYLVDSLIPEHLRENYPTYVSFVREYLKVLEDETGPFAVLNKLTEFIDINVTPDETLTNFVYQYLNSFPVDFLGEIDIREFVSNSKNFYSQKGNEAAVRFIFNLKGGMIDFYYPCTNIFEICSSTLSGDDKIHDNKYYAYYVYEIITDLNFTDYENILRKMTHAIGEKLFFKTIIMIDMAGQIFDMSVADEKILIEQENNWQMIMPADNVDYENHIYIEGYGDNKVDDLSDIINDYTFAETGKVIDDFKHLTPYELAFESVAAFEMNLTVNSSTISFANSDSSINTTTDDELDDFIDGQIITVTGSVGNSSTFTINGTPTQYKIIVNETIITEAVGPLILIKSEGAFSFGADIPRNFSVLNGSVTAIGDQLTFTGNGDARNPSYWVAGEKYHIIITVSSYSSGSFLPPYTGALTPPTGYLSGNGTYEYDYTPDTTLMMVYSNLLNGIVNVDSIRKYL